MKKFTVRRCEEFNLWLKDLKDTKVRARLVTRLERAEAGNLGDVKSVGDGVFEMREHFGPGWRIYYTQRGDTLIVILAGGDKGSQQRDIARAVKMAATIEDEEDHSI